MSLLANWLYTKMKKFIVSFSGAVDIEAKDENEAREKWLDMEDVDIGHAVEEYDEIKESDHN